MLLTLVNIWPLDRDHQACAVSALRLQLRNRGNYRLHVCDPCVNLCVYWLGSINVSAMFKKAVIIRMFHKFCLSSRFEKFLLGFGSKANENRVTVWPSMLWRWLTTVGSSAQEKCIKAKRTIGWECHLPVARLWTFVLIFRPQVCSMLA